MPGNATTRTRRTAKANGHGDASQSALALALASEDEIAAKAAEIRGDATTLDGALFLRLLPLLRQPIPDGFIQTIGAVTGKPYESTGIKSVQVQINRMDNVLTPLWWTETVEYTEEGKVCKVTVSIGDDPDRPFVSRSSMGGVNQASTRGNLFKGSYTNAAKVAFARVGPGWEVYVGATDLDPDVHEQTAGLQGKPDTPSGTFSPQTTPVSRVKARELVDAVWAVGCEAQLPLALAHVLGDDPGDVSTKPKATDAVCRLTPVQASKVEAWVNKKAAEKPAQTELGDAA